MALPTNANGKKEWATGLVGLRMKVPGSWWDNSDISEHQLHAGKMHCINFEQTQNQNYCQLQLYDIHEPDLYPMRYDAALLNMPTKLVPHIVASGFQSSSLLAQ